MKVRVNVYVADEESCPSVIERHLAAPTVFSTTPSHNAILFRFNKNLQFNSAIFVYGAIEMSLLLLLLLL